MSAPTVGRTSALTSEAGMWAEWGRLANTVRDSADPLASLYT